MRSISTNYSRNPQQKFFFHIFLSLVVSSWRHELQMANEADAGKCCWVSGLVKQATAIKSHGKYTGKKLQSENVES